VAPQKEEDSLETLKAILSSSAVKNKGIATSVVALE